MALHSSYLSDIRSYFRKHRGALSFLGTLEFEEEDHPELSEELWEVVLWLRFDVYLVLTVWGDSRATFVVRESAKKRMHKVLLRVMDFPLLASAESVFLTFRKSAATLHRLSMPPGSQADRRILASVRALWLDISRTEPESIRA
jgi:hypothetical protein